MSSIKCIGCGVELQNENENIIGYTPKKISQSNKNEYYCKRCFQLKNYGKFDKNNLSKEDYKSEIENILNETNLVLAIFDIMDFESSFDVGILDILREKDSIIVINKIDLLNEKHPSEISNWVKERLEKEDIVPLDIAIISTKNTYGVNGILKKINHFYKNCVNAMLLGVTNVGKSSLLNRLIGEKKLTISKYPGTTIKSMKYKIPNMNIYIYDTPGLIPNGRISDLICDKCSTKLVSSSRISRMTFKSKKDSIIFLDNLIKFRVLNEDNPIFSIYAPKSVKFHETNIKKSKELENSSFFTIPCENCLEKYKSLNKIRKIFKINIGEDLNIKGLGWIEVKRGPLLIELSYPENIEITIRKSLHFLRNKKI